MKLSSKTLLRIFGLVCLTVAGYGLTNFAHHSQTTEAILTYYVLPISVAVLFWLSSRASAPIQTYTVIGTFSLAFAAYSAEVYFTYINPIVDVHPGARAVQQDGKTRLDVITELRARDVDAVPYLNGLRIYRRSENGDINSPIDLNGKEIWPLGTISDATIVVCREGREFLTYKSDRYGFSNPPGVWDERPVLLAFVGDSFTHGECVAPEESFVGQVRSTYSPTLNLGVSGAGPLTELATVKEYLPELKPRFVLWVFFEGNDIGDLAAEMKSPALRNYLMPGHRQDLAKHQPLIDREYRRLAQQAFDNERARQKKESKTKFLNTVKLTNVRLIVRLTKNIETRPSLDSQENFREVLSEAKKTVESWNGKLILVYLPSWTRYHPQLKHGNEDLSGSILEEVAKELDLTVLNARKALEMSDSNTLNLYQGHLTERGNKIVAQAILSALADLRIELNRN